MKGPDRCSVYESEKNKNKSTRPDVILSARTAMHLENCNARVQASRALLRLESLLCEGGGGGGCENTSRQTSAVSAQIQSVRKESNVLLTSLVEVEAMHKNCVSAASPRGGPLDLLLALQRLCYFFHTSVSRIFFHETVVSRLDHLSLRLAGCSRRLQAVKERRKVKVQCGSFATTTVAERCKNQLLLTRSVGGERGYALVTSQRAYARVEAFIPQRLAPLREATFMNPSKEGVRQCNATRAREQAWLSRLSRTLHDERTTLSTLTAETERLANFVFETATNGSETGSSWSERSVPMVVRRLQTDLQQENTVVAQHNLAQMRSGF